jgi:molecular chaperone GrpE
MEENENREAEEASSQSTLDDPRFEVKWRKKEAPRTTPPETVSVSPAPSVDEMAELHRQLDEERARVTDLQDKWQRSAAEVANLRRRHEGEREEMEKMAGMQLVYDLLPVVDNFDRAIASVPGNLARLTWIHGVMLIERQMRAILESRGVTAIDALQKPFDPHYHEAVSERETDEAPPGTVISQYQSGYTMHGYVIRPAMVEVAKAQAPSPTAAPAPDGGVEEPSGETIADEALQENIGP